jgi:hypothetical protein
MSTHNDKIRLYLSGFVDDLQVGYADGNYRFRFDFICPQYVDQPTQLALSRFPHRFGQLETSEPVRDPRLVRFHNMQQGDRSAKLPRKRGRALQRPRH